MGLQMEGSPILKQKAEEGQLGCVNCSGLPKSPSPDGSASFIGLSCQGQGIVWLDVIVT
jgi:hypothetical protein